MLLSSSGYLPQSLVHVLLNLVIAHITDDSYLISLFRQVFTASIKLSLFRYEFTASIKLRLSASGYTPQPIVNVIAHITYDFIHNYILKGRFVMQDGIHMQSCKSKKHDFRSALLPILHLHTLFQCKRVHRVISTALYCLSVVCSPSFIVHGQ